VLTLDGTIINAEIRQRGRKNGDLFLSVLDQINEIEMHLGGIILVFGRNLYPRLSGSFQHL